MRIVLIGTTSSVVGTSIYLYYIIVAQTMQDTATCSDVPGVCVDRLRLIFPGVGECERCGSPNSPTNANCMDRAD